jgi:hypothetical protein
MRAAAKIVGVIRYSITAKAIPRLDAPRLDTIHLVQSSNGAGSKECPCCMGQQRIRRRAFSCYERGPCRVLPTSGRQRYCSKLEEFAF